jgi:YVTN family beta-propeller protein
MMKRKNVIRCRAASLVSSQAARLSRGSGAIFADLSMLIAVLLIALGAATAHAQQSQALEGETGFVYTADEYGNSISAVDLATGQVETVPVAISPHNIQATADGARLLVVGNPATDSAMQGHSGDGHESEVEGQLLVFDPRNLSSGPLVSIPVGEHPAHVVVDREGRRAFVTLSGQNAIAVVDLERNEILRKIETGRYPHGLRISPDGRVIYVANVKDDSVSVIDVTELAEVAWIPVGRAPVQVGFTPDGRHVYVSLRDENKVAVIDTEARKVIAQIAVGRNPIQVHVTPDGRFVYVANQGTEAEPADTASVIDVAAGTVVGTIRTGEGAHGVAVSEDGRYVFVTNIAAGTVSAIDAATRTVAGTFKVGRGPNGITFRSGVD